MPELPEVETVARSLRPLVVGWTITDVATGPHRLRAPLDREALQALRGQTVRAVERLGKYLLFRLDPGGRTQAAPERLLLSHLGMTGRYTVTPGDAEAAPHTHVRIDLERADRRGRAPRPQQLRYVDPRRFGLLVVRPAALADVPELSALGPDPLGPAFTPAYLADALRATARPLKAALLDQGLVAGLGNIYVAECLFLAGLSPARAGQRVRRAEAERLHRAIREVLEAAVARRGTTLSDGGYVDAAGNQGDNQQHLAVYGREALPCPRCGAAIRRVVQAQRSTFFCPGCQR